MRINTHKREVRPFPSLGGGEEARKFRPRRKGLWKEQTNKSIFTKKKIFRVRKENGKD